jgi:hypothetical protein
MAVAVGGTEAVAFAFDPLLREPRLLLHIRPDNSDAVQRAAAVAAFKEIIEPCLREGLNGAIRVGERQGAQPPQFCLVSLVHDAQRRMDLVTGAIAIITRCDDQDVAERRLNLIARHA